jgi:small conductance mechanosensitive channel
MDRETIQPYLDKAIELSMAYLPKVVLAVLTLIIGFWVIKRVIKGLNRVLGHKAVDDTLQKFMTSFVDVLLKILLLVAVAGMVGVETTSFIAMLGAIGLAVGLALQGSLGNFAGGVLILFFKPYRASLGYPDLQYHPDYLRQPAHRDSQRAHVQRLHQEHFRGTPAARGYRVWYQLWR